MDVSAYRMGFVWEDAGSVVGWVKTFVRRFADVWKCSSSYRRLENVWKTCERSSTRLPGCKARSFPAVALLLTYVITL